MLRRRPRSIPTDIIVSSDGHVWVPRNQRFGIKTVLYDVFDRQGQRVDRVELPPATRVIGFGQSCVYAVERDDKDTRIASQIQTLRAFR